MKVSVIQPKYLTDYEKSEEYFEYTLGYLRSCDSSMDIIVLPESSDIPCLAATKEDAEESVRKFNKKLLEEASNTAKRCNAIVFVNARCETENGLRNTTFAFDRQGVCVGKYFKQHLVPSEISVMKLDHDYTYEFEEPTVIEIEGIRFGFLVCYDFYFYESFANMARKNLDVIIGCSHQRSDTHSALEIMSRFLAYNTNAYVIRSSISMDETSDICGASMVVAPNGDVLLNMKSRVGVESVDIDITKKYYKPAGYGNPPAAHYEYIETGRRPWKYRPAGSAIVRHDEIMPYPRVCAHRGFNTIAPENSMPAFGAAVAMGADEIEFDLWATKDGEIVSIHDPVLDRVSDGRGYVFEHTYEELTKFDFGSKFGEKYAGLKIVKFEDILKKFACHVVMNVHIKTFDNTTPYDKEIFKKIVDLIDKYDCRKYVYFMGSACVHAVAKELAPDICRCMGEHLDAIKGEAPSTIVERAIEYGCKKVQFFRPFVSREMIEKAHANGIRCNIFWADEPEMAEEYLKMGMDTILTNDYNLIAQVVEKYK